MVQCRCQFSRASVDGGSCPPPSGGRVDGHPCEPRSRKTRYGSPAQAQWQWQWQWRWQCAQVELSATSLPVKLAGFPRMSLYTILNTSTQYASLWFYEFSQCKEVVKKNGKRARECHAYRGVRRSRPRSRRAVSRETGASALRLSLTSAQVTWCPAG